MKNQSRWGISRLVVLSGFALVMVVGVSRAEAGELRGDGRIVQQPAGFKDARIGDDPDSIPMDSDIVDDPGSGEADIVDDPSPFGGPVHIRNPMVACTVRDIGEDPDPIPKIVWVSCRNIGNDPDPIPPNH